MANGRICGLDECGRGAWAGPLVAAAVILRQKYKSKKIKGLSDSKKLSIFQRNRLYKKILRTAEVVEVEVVTARQINNHGMGWANKEIFRKLIKGVEADKYIVDGNLKLGRIRNKTEKIRSLVDADATVAEVMAASIVAKVTRDKLMKELHMKHPAYGWQTNVGYGTEYHIRAITEYGTVHYHRGVFVTTGLRTVAKKSDS